MLDSIPLTDDARAAVDEGQTTLDQVLERLTDVPTPAGPTPRQIGVPTTATLLPIIDATQGPAAGGSDVSGGCQTRPDLDQEGRP
ncbi:hypothetical protein [Streptomyces sp. NPDC050564]|uniref:hypothetical protein n=1 Tax=Streptomyces sp. NPDC050564 TaxID=3365631 RepID=UPI0037A71257